MGERSKAAGETHEIIIEEFLDVDGNSIMAIDSADRLRYTCVECGMSEHGPSIKFWSDISCNSNRGVETAVAGEYGNLSAVKKARKDAEADDGCARPHGSGVGLLAIQGASDLAGTDAAEASIGCWNSEATTGESDLRGDGMAKIGFPYVEFGLYPEAAIEGGWVEVPSMYIIGEKDPGCGGYRGGILQAIPQAEAEGLSNCGWQYDGLREVIANQSNSPHVFDLSPTGDHVETNRTNPVNGRVDNFLSEVWSTNPPPVFQ